MSKNFNSLILIFTTSLLVVLILVKTASRFLSIIFLIFFSRTTYLSLQSLFFFCGEILQYSLPCRKLLSGYISVRPPWFFLGTVIDLLIFFLVSRRHLSLLLCVFQIQCYIFHYLLIPHRDS